MQSFATNNIKNWNLAHFPKGKANYSKEIIYINTSLTRIVQRISPSWYIQKQ
jgi:hypothetical protein